MAKLDIDTAPLSTAGTFGPVGSPSGTLQVSGGIASASATSSTVYQAEWMVEEQDLNIAYCRVPSQWFNGTDTLTLSSYNVSEAATAGGILGTRLACIVTASYEKKKVIQAFNSSSFTQLQTFEINGTSSLEGVTYGPLSANQLGPQGDIKTKHKYYNRRTWIENVDVTANESVICANVAYNASSIGYSGSCITHHVHWKDASQYYNNLRANFLAPGAVYSPLNSNYYHSDVHCEVMRQLHQLPGPYHTTQETSITAVWNMLDWIGTNLRGEHLFVLIPQVSTGNFIASADRTGIPSYDKSRHDYS